MIPEIVYTLKISCLKIYVLNNLMVELKRSFRKVPLKNLRSWTEEAQHLDPGSVSSIQMIATYNPQRGVQCPLLISSGTSTQKLNIHTCRQTTYRRKINA